MGQVIDVSQATFANDVLNRSQSVPVVVDFWAPWCGPCRMLGPVLERLAHEPDSGFVLAKVNVDQNPQLSMQYGVQGIPAVKAFRNGEVVDGFVGAQPEPMVRQFLQKLTANGRQQRPTAAQPQMQLEPQARLAEAQRLLRRGDGCKAGEHLRELQDADAAKLKPLATFLCDVAQGRRYTSSSEVDQLYQQAANAMRRREPLAALYALLTVYHRETNKRRVVRIAEGIMWLHQDDKLVASYQQQFAG